jgi:hypothetical protein
MPFDGPDRDDFWDDDGGDFDEPPLAKAIDAEWSCPRAGCAR